MGRYITCNGDTVYKYVFARQESEQGRINEELDLGDYYQASDHDLLELSREDAYQLRQHLQEKGFDALKVAHDSILQEHPGGTRLDNDGKLFSWTFEGEYDKAETAFAEAHDWDFLVMLDNIASYIEAHPNTEEPFVFEGEF